MQPPFPFSKMFKFFHVVARHSPSSSKLRQIDPSMMIAGFLASQSPSPALSFGGPANTSNLQPPDRSRPAVAFWQLVLRQCWRPRKIVFLFRNIGIM